MLDSQAIETVEIDEALIERLATLVAIKTAKGSDHAEWLTRERSLAVILALIATLTALASPLSAAPQVVGPLAVFSAQAHVEIVSALRADGYEVTSVTRTWLGRVKIKAVKNGLGREVVVSRHTGEVKSDRSYAPKASNGNGSNRNSGGNGNGGGNDDNDDDD